MPYQYTNNSYQNASDYGLPVAGARSPALAQAGDVLLSSYMSCRARDNGCMTADRDHL